jgi:hypothetical protein
MQIGEDIVISSKKAYGSKTEKSGVKKMSVFCAPPKQVSVVLRRFLEDIPDKMGPPFHLPTMYICI